MRIHIGTSGYNYPEWRGSFYPEGFSTTKMFAFYAERFRTVEINATFYRTQSAASFQKWAKSTPDDFQFSVKAPRAAVQRKDLREAAQSIEWFFNSGVGELGSKLGPIFWQMAPYKKCDPAEMTAYFDMLPEKLGKLKLRHAIEVRHQSFIDGGAAALLRRYNIALVVADTAGKWPLVQAATADFVYARLHGDKKLYASGYTRQALQSWAGRIRKWMQGQAAPGIETLRVPGPARKPRAVYVYFDNDAKVKAPGDAEALADLLDVRPDFSGEERTNRRATRRRSYETS